MHRIFVYGTLKRGQYNHYYMSDDGPGISKFLGEARSEKCYPLVVASYANNPFLLNVPGNGQHVLGEIYEVDEDRLITLDKFEGHPNYYERGDITVEMCGQDCARLTCYTYWLNNFKPSLLELPYMDTYGSGQPNGLIYVPPKDRPPDRPVRLEVKEQPC